MSTPPMPQSTVSHSGMLSRSPGATNLPSRPMIRPATSTPRISIVTPLVPAIGGRSRLLYPAPPTLLTRQDTSKLTVVPHGAPAEGPARSSGGRTPDRDSARHWYRPPQSARERPWPAAWDQLTTRCHRQERSSRPQSCPGRRAMARSRDVTSLGRCGYFTGPTPDLASSVRWDRSVKHQPGPDTGPTLPVGSQMRSDVGASVDG